MISDQDWQKAWERTYAEATKMRGEIEALKDILRAALMYKRLPIKIERRIRTILASTAQNEGGK